MGQGALIFHANLLESTYCCERIFSDVGFLDSSVALLNLILLCL